MSSISGIRNVQRYINSTGQDLGRNFQKEIINRTRILSKNLQTGMTNSVDRGAVPFTNRAVMFTYQKPVLVSPVKSSLRNYRRSTYITFS
jgi:hypothetical protein